MSQAQRYCARARRGQRGGRRWRPASAGPRDGKNHSSQGEGRTTAPLSQWASSGTDALLIPPRGTDGTFHARSAARHQPGAAAAEGGQRVL